MNKNQRKSTFSSPSVERQNIESLSAKLLAATAQLSEANTHLRQIQREREEMLSNISHDLRAPVTAIRSSIDYLKSREEISSAEYQNTINLIDRRTTVLENLIQDMYFLFCVEDTSKDFSFQAIDAAPFFETYFFDALADSRYQNHDLVLDMPRSLECTLQIDAQKIVRVLDNLFSNAAKYSPEGSQITLQVRLSSKAPVKTLCFSVIDNGPGIPQDALPYIFNRTYTVSSSRTPNSATGSGLGLSIVKAIVERHQGTVSCSCPSGQGCCFEIILPVS